MTFNIGEQNGGVINNVGGDQTIHGGQRGEVITIVQARKAARALREAVERADLPDSSTVLRPAEDIETEVQSEAPNRAKVARSLEIMAAAVTSVDGLVRWGSAVVEPMRVLATWLGTLGLTALGMLPTLA
jgi:D-aminopeptidase